jgi:hypothetical protein
MLRFVLVLALCASVGACAARAKSAAPKTVANAHTYAIAGGVLAPLAMPVGAMVTGRIGGRDRVLPGFVAGAVGTVVLASAGGWYAASPLSLVGLGLHAAGVIAVAWSVGHWFGSGDTNDESDEERAFVEQRFYAGIVSYVAGTVWDVATAGHRVRDWNRKMQVVPTATGSSAGLALTGRF